MSGSAARRAPGPDARRRDADRTRAQLLEAASEIFAAKGLSGARVQEIATRAGVDKQLISYYFGGKDGLYAEVLERRGDMEQAYVHMKKAFSASRPGLLHREDEDSEETASLA